MLVRDLMTRNPVVVRPESDPIGAQSLFKAGGFRHLPVVDAQGKCVGIVDRADVELFLSRAGSPGIMKRQHRIDQVMTSPVISVAPDWPIEDAARLMIEHKIGSLPVLEDRKVVGIITETDIFKLFATLLGGGTAALRLTVRVPDVPGQLAELTSRIARANGNVCSVVQVPADRAGYVEITLRVTGAARDDVVRALQGIAELTTVHVWECGSSHSPPERVL